ncbi:hypothetical protein [Phreatobacter sp. AB_2022a]|uniref:hypothetical protein n=1 Tax=Phreatobacter sp. AB_2022a TaxID=3003134 RepID=UPI0022875679|nr:hypothetical protein [Phreatobacter sp. AB_2022a]MCZ0733003.1 hypothetical protein [Phreatobacter sp. AB_2022a]
MHLLSFFAAEIVDDDNVAGPQGRQQRFFDINREAAPLINVPKTQDASMPMQRCTARKLRLSGGCASLAASCRRAISSLEVEQYWS